MHFVKLEKQVSKEQNDTERVNRVKVKPSKERTGVLHSTAQVKTSAISGFTAEMAHFTAKLRLSTRWPF